MWAVLDLKFELEIQLKISQNSEENISDVVSFLIKLQTWLATLLKMSHRFMCFPMNFLRATAFGFSKRAIQNIKIS